ncbi:MAG: hypothetical protein GY952_04990 [Rhodobacteraceae bacterium]|nr:hypothetical protein [Paracoccaceae bacterium]
MTQFFLNAFILSFSIFWRAVPGWLVLAAAIYVFGSFFGEHPLIFGFFLLLGAGPVMVLMAFIHIRSGLTALDEVTPPALRKMALRSFKFFRFFALFNALMVVLSFFGIWCIAKYVSLDMDRIHWAINTGNSAALRSELSGLPDLPAVYALQFIVGMVWTLIYSALAVPMAANAAACTPKGRDVEIFWGFGAYTGRMFLLNMISGVVVFVLLLTYFFIVATMPMFDGQSLFELVRGETLLTPTTTASRVMLVAVAIMPILGFVWLVSLWCAGATLCFRDHRNQLNAEREMEMARVYEKPMSIEELRDLRRSREVSFAR